MTDVLTKEQRTFCMSQIQGRNTKPEVALRKGLWNIGYRYRIKSKLAGKPDIVFASFRTVIFIDGCFWHKCPDHFNYPKTRADFWLHKINGNVERDRRNNEILKSQGWTVIRIWEHEIKDSLDGCVRRLAKILERQRERKPT